MFIDKRLSVKKKKKKKEEKKMNKTNHAYTKKWDLDRSIFMYTRQC